MSGPSDYTASTQIYPDLNSTSTHITLAFMRETARMNRPAFQHSANTGNTTPDTISYSGEDALLPTLRSHVSAESEDARCSLHPGEVADIHLRLGPIKTDQITFEHSHIYTLHAPHPSLSPIYVSHEQEEVSQHQYELFLGEYENPQIPSPPISALPSWTAPEAQHPQIKIENDSSTPSSLTSESIEDFDLQSPLEPSIGDISLAITTMGARRHRSRPDQLRITKSRSSSCLSPKPVHSAGVSPSLPRERHFPESVQLTSPATAVQPDSQPGETKRHPLPDSASSPQPVPEPAYPEDFAAKVMSKRIAHKLSEKTRRNRLTSAIREIEKLLPVATGEMHMTMKASVDLDVKREGSIDGGLGQGQKLRKTSLTMPISKVDVVEMAVGYIQRLQREHEEARRRVGEMERAIRGRYCGRLGSSEEEEMKEEMEM